MSEHQHHIIHSLRYEVQFEDSIPADQQNALGRMHHEKVQGLFQQVLDSATESDRYLRIDNLELDLGIIPPEGWEDIFIARLEKNLFERIEKAKKEPGISHPSEKAAGRSDISDDITVLSTEEREEDIFLFFLENGYLNWIISKDIPVSVNNIFKKILSGKSKSFNRRLRSLFLHSGVSRSRFVAQIHPHLRGQWMKSILPAAGELYEEILTLPENIVHYLEISGSLLSKICIWLEENLILHSVQQEEKDFSPEEFLGICPEKFLKTFCDSPVIKGPIYLLNPYEEAENKTLKLVIPLLLKTAGASGEREEPDYELVNMLREKEGREEPKTRQKEELEKGIPAENAGLVILWPYFYTLFSEFNLMTGKRFKGEEEANQALYMLHYLATGVCNAEEHELLIPKILTGYDTDKVVSGNVLFDNLVMTECDHLLETVIKHWTALKSTSPNGLRQTFLKRHALIKAREEGWHFIFERTGVDALLDRLPYGISVIKMKWLDNPIYVTW